MVAFGWKGGTIQQLSSITGVDSYTLLYEDYTPKIVDNDFYDGFSWDTNSKEHQKYLTQKYYGIKEYWSGVARKMEVLNKNCNIPIEKIVPFYSIKS